MHVDEVRYREADDKLFYCAYTFGGIDVSDPGDPEYLAQGFEWDLDSPVNRTRVSTDPGLGIEYLSQVVISVP